MTTDNRQRTTNNRRKAIDEYSAIQNKRTNLNTKYSILYTLT
jgi:hypothetical protein